MADEQYLTSLQPFVLLAKSATGRAAADLVMQATAAPGCFVFSELLEMPNIQALSTTEDGRRYFDLLKIFAYGWYRDYKENAANLPPLTPAHLQKLRQLSLITLSSQGPQNLTYASLQRTLDLPSIRELEDLTISAIYARLLVAKLDTQASRVEVSSTAGRDVAPEEVPNMIATLRNWCRQCEDVLGDIDEQVRCVKRGAVARKRAAEEYERVLSVRKELIKAEEKGVLRDPIPGVPGKGKRVISEGEDVGNRWGDDDEMDIDEGAFEGVSGANTSKRRTKKGLGGIWGGRGRR